MSVISTLIEPHRVTRVFFDCRDVVPDPADLRRIEQAIERSIALPQADDCDSAPQFDPYRCSNLTQGEGRHYQSDQRSNQSHRRSILKRRSLANIKTKNLNYINAISINLPGSNLDAETHSHA